MLSGLPTDTFKIVHEDSGMSPEFIGMAVRQHLSLDLLRLSMIAIKLTFISNR